MEKNGNVSNISSSLKETVTDIVKPGKQGPRKWRRVHGFQAPLHPQQIIAWILLLYFTTVSFCVIIPAFEEEVYLAFNILHVVIYSCHLMMHVVSMLLDPADYNLRAKEGNKKKKKVPEFDRRQHAHVIENGRCHLCSITISTQRTKHCSTCNKCVDVFDHHCKWLNQCIGRRNYKWFMGSVITAICMSLIFVCLSITLICASSIPSAGYLLRQYPTQNISNGTRLFANQTIITQSFELFYIRVPEEAFITMIAVSLAIAFIALGLLLHLLAFHIYIRTIGITTYEYVRAHRVAQERQMQQNIEDNKPTHPEKKIDSREMTSKKFGDSPNSSESQLQWDKLEKEHGGGSAVRDKKDCCLTSFCSLLSISCCSKKKSNVYPMPYNNTTNESSSKPANPTGQNANDYQITEHNDKALRSKALNSQKEQVFRDVPIEPGTAYEATNSSQGNFDSNFSHNSDMAKDVITSKVPKLPSITISSTNVLPRSTTSSRLMENVHTPKHIDDSVSQKQLELLELKMKTVEEQDNLRNGKRHQQRSNGVNLYNHRPWNHHHEDQDAIFVVDA